MAKPYTLSQKLAMHASGEYTLTQEQINEARAGDMAEQKVSGMPTGGDKNNLYSIYYDLSLSLLTTGNTRKTASDYIKKHYGL